MNSSQADACVDILMRQNKISITSSNRTTGPSSGSPELDRGIYPISLKITDAELTGLNLKLAKFHGDWNYTLLPLRKKI